MRVFRVTFGLLSLQAYQGTVINALIEPIRNGTVAENQYVNSNLGTSETRFTTKRDNLINNNLANRLQHLEAKFNLPSGNTVVDTRSGVVANLRTSVPIIPGGGVGNNFAPTRNLQTEDWSEIAITAVQNWLSENEDDLGIDVSELFARGTVRSSVHGADGDLIQLSLQRTFHGILVVGSRATATVKRGNLISIGFESWGTISSSLSVRPSIRVEEARNALANHAGWPMRNAKYDQCPSELRILTFTNGDSSLANVGSGYTHALAWRVCPTFEGQTTESIEGYVDAHTREVFKFFDAVEYFHAKGSIFPLTNNGDSPLGVQTVAPMPFMNVGSEVTDASGNYYNSGPQTARFEGPYVKIADVCGEASLTQTDGIDWGSHSGTDCSTPGFGGPGNTHSSRTGFYELNRMIELARSHLPDNPWLQSQVVANMNIDDTCNAIFDSITGELSFYRSSEWCANSGEIAHVFDHEWGHGMDYNDVAAGISEPSGEGIADIYASLRLGNSCIGEGFFQSGTCSAGLGNVNDPCISCTGVRDIDYKNYDSQSPHTFTWMFNNCADEEGYYSVHCIGQVYSEAVWSLYKRELPQIYGYDDNTSLEIVQRLTFIAAGNVALWFDTTYASAPFAGCGNNSGYNAYLAADDDDGDINNGTPHMQAIFKAFNDQEIACYTPGVQDSGCAGTPDIAPTVTATPLDRSVVLTWTDVGATVYQIFRAHGAMGCNQGKVLLGETNLLSFYDETIEVLNEGLMNGLDYYYIVIPKGNNVACFGPASSCTPVIPTIPEPSPRPILEPSKAPTTTPSKAPNVAPEPSKTPSKAPSKTPSKAPTSKKPSIDMNEKSRIRIMFQATFNVTTEASSGNSRRFVKPHEEALFVATIEEVMTSGLNETQRLLEVTILDILGTVSLIVQYEVVLEELCSNTCEEQVESTNLYEDITSYMDDEIKKGNFDSTLQRNAIACGGACDNFKTAFVEVGVYGRPLVDVVTSEPSKAPTVVPTPSMSPSEARTPSPINGNVPGATSIPTSSLAPTVLSKSAKKRKRAAKAGKSKGTKRSNVGKSKGAKRSYVINRTRGHITDTVYDLSM